MTSVKEFRVERAATADELGRGAFAFTDDYSVFDWGKMPDEIPDKGASLCTMGAFNFELLEDAGVPTHYEGVVPAGADEPVPLSEATAPPREMAIALTQVPDLPFVGGAGGADEDAGAGTVLNGYDYGAYHDAAGDNYLVPLEIVFRNRVPVGSSLRNRSAPVDHGLDREAWPDEPVDLSEPVVEFSTKYEQQDRYLDRAEADRIAGRAGVEALADLAREVNRVVTERAREAGFVHQDGKIEVLYYGGELRVADVVGTFDENRFSYDGQQVSKEVVRQYHKRTQPGWVEAVSAAKREADERGIADWKSLCDREPEPLDEDVIRVARDLYCAGANAYAGTDWFDAPSIDAAVQAAREL
jgi:phosphoribosylaminoimidazole-succinocarboxamide synthase